MYHTETLQQNQIENPITKFTYTFRWGADSNAFCAYAVSYSVWYVGEGVLHAALTTACDWQPTSK